MWEPVALPYVRHENALPHPLPNAQQIRESEILISKRTGQTIAAVTPDILVKYGKATHQREGQTLLYLEACLPQIPAPRLYAMYHDDGDLFIVMERLAGTSLDRVWGDLTNAAKEPILADLKNIFETLRTVPCPQPKFFSSIDGSHLRHHLFYSADRDPKVTGPFSDEDGFNRALVLHHGKIAQMNNAKPWRTLFYSRHLSTVLHGHKATLTHGDLQRKNIIVLDQPALDSRLHPFKVALVDWEDAGWYQSYWEYFVAYTSLRWDDDWSSKVEDIVQAWPAETAMMRMSHADLFY